MASKRKSSTQPKNDRSGLGATCPTEGSLVRAEIEALIGMSAGEGYSRCAIPLGLDAAIALLDLAQFGWLQRNYLAEQAAFKKRARRKFKFSEAEHA